MPCNSVRNSPNFLGDLLGRKNEIYTSACYRARRHIWPSSCLEALVKKNKLENHVIFHNRFVELKELTEFLERQIFTLLLIWTRPRLPRER
jgi:hypothetical protein